MSVTYGFYNSLNHDRKYDALQISRIFDGIINDGIFSSIGTCFVVTADGTGLGIEVGVGRAWFDHSWILNDAILPLTASDSEVLLDRIDAVVIETNSSEAVRANSIKIINGTPSSSPVNPTLAATTTVHQYALCYIYRTAGSTVITQADITNKVGTADTPFITGILQTVSLDTLLGQWESELDQFKDDQESEFTTWFNTIKDQLGEDAAGALQNEIDALDTRIDGITPASIGAASLSGGKVTPEQASAAIDNTTISVSTTAYTVAATDAGKCMVSMNEAACTVTLPGTLPVGTEIEFCQGNVGALTFVCPSGMSAISMDNALSTAGQYACVVAKMIGSTVWLLSGALA